MSQQHADPTEGTIFPFPKSRPNERTTIKLDLTIPIQKTREQRLNEEFEQEQKRLQKLKEQQQQQEEEEEKRKKQHQQAEEEGKAKDEEKDALEQSITELVNPNNSNNNHTNTTTIDDENSTTFGTFSSIAISKFDSPDNSPKTHHQNQKPTSSDLPKQEERIPLWAIDNLGFFLITKESEGSQPYAPSNHKFAEKFTNILSLQQQQQQQQNSSSSLNPAATASSLSTVLSESMLMNPTTTITSDNKCDVLLEAVKEKIDWWKTRARELDSPSSSRNTIAENHQLQLSGWRRILLHEIRVKVRREGITPAERVVAWPLLGGLEYDRSERLQRCMENLERRSIDTEMREVMLRDLGRTLPTHVLFRGVGSLGQTRLERVLVCYCALDPEVGYCQGMGFIVAVLLLHMPEADAFGLFVQMMQSKRYQMRALFQSGFPLLQRMLELFRRLLRLVLPQLMDHFDALGIDPAFFASHWFLTLFSYQFSVPVVCRIWDLFLSEGWIWIYRVAIALLLSDQDALMSMTMEDILMHVKLIHEGKSDDEILRLAKQVAIRESDLVTLESEYLAENDENNSNINVTTKNGEKRFP